MSGWAPALQPEISRGLRDLGFGVTGVSGGTVPAGQPVPRLEPGAAVGLQLVSGDANLAAIGTVTMVDGDRVLAFGHPMIQAGPVAVPMTGAVIQTVLPNLEVSFKMGSATAPVGGIFEDRRTGVAGKMGPVPPMIPVTVTVEGPGSAPNVFHYQVVRQPALTPMFLPWAVTNAYLAAGWAEGDAWARSDVTVWYDGGQSLHRTERFSTDSPGTSLGNEITLPATLLLTNPFERARLDSINVRLGFDRRKSEARVLRMSAPQTKLHVGDTLAVRVTIDPYRGAQEDRVVRFPIPAGWAGQRIVVSAGGIAEMIDWDKDRAPGKYAPENMGQLRMLIEQVPDEATLIVRAVSRTSGSLVGVRELPGLPPSLAAASEAAGNQSSVRDTAGSLLAEQRIDTPWLVSGRETIQVEVAE